MLDQDVRPQYRYPCPTCDISSHRLSLIRSKNGIAQLSGSRSGIMDHLTRHRLAWGVASTMIPTPYNSGGATAGLIVTKSPTFTDYLFCFCSHLYNRNIIPTVKAIFTINIPAATSQVSQPINADLQSSQILNRKNYQAPLLLRRVYQPHP